MTASWGVFPLPGLAGEGARGRGLLPHQTSEVFRNFGSLISVGAYGNTPLQASPPQSPSPAELERGTLTASWGVFPLPGLAGEGARGRGLLPHQTSEVFRNFGSLIAAPPGLSPSIPLSSRAREGDLDRWHGAFPLSGLAGEGARGRGFLPHQTSEVFGNFGSLIAAPPGLTPSIPLSSGAREGDFDRQLGRFPPPWLGRGGGQGEGPSAEIQTSPPLGADAPRRPLSTLERGKGQAGRSQGVR